MRSKSPNPSPNPPANAKKPLPGARCEEASPLSHAFYIPCGAPAEFIVKNRDPQPYAMCFGCADHNVRNRGARYVTDDES